MSDGLFDTFGVDADSVEIPTGGPTPGTYDATIKNVEVKQGTKNDATAVNLIFSYQIEGYDFPVQQYFGLPKRKAPWDDSTVIRVTDSGRKVTEKSDNDFKLGTLKKHLLALGVPENRVNSVKPQDLIGASVVLTLVQNGQYVNIARNGVAGKQESEDITLPTPEAPATETPAWG